MNQQRRRRAIDRLHYQQRLNYFNNYRKPKPVLGKIFTFKTIESNMTTKSQKALREAKNAKKEVEQTTNKIINMNAPASAPKFEPENRFNDNMDIEKTYLAMEEAIRFFLGKQLIRQAERDGLVGFEVNNTETILGLDLFISKISIIATQQTMNTFGELMNKVVKCGFDSFLLSQLQAEMPHFIADFNLKALDLQTNLLEVDERLKVLGYTDAMLDRFLPRVNEKG